MEARCASLLQQRNQRSTRRRIVWALYLVMCLNFIIFNKVANVNSDVSFSACITTADIRIKILCFVYASFRKRRSSQCLHVNHTCLYRFLLMQRVLV
ncbi:hypothetical protein V8B55DRAFT_1064468 [Mucor lusitanicus]|uniref:Uncharacterized protein n=1 Tax=Mucor circinelloides f. lusitanicus TaxID=29924 RepID=A0A8H4BNQ0_MUCCL|nr:hypothetical protein FB192DRAFT_1364193 [Mucor lusitanicus]